MNARSWNDLKRRLDGHLKKYYFGRHSDADNRNWASTVSKKKLIVGIFNHEKFIRIPPIVSKSVIFEEFGPVLFLSANTGQYQIQFFHFSRYLIDGGNVLKNFKLITSETNVVT